MTADSTWSVQKAVYARLCAHAPLTALLALGAEGVHDHLPEDAPLPRIVFGEMEARPLGTQGGNGYDIAFTILTQSRAEGMKQLRGVMEAVTAALHRQDFAVEGHTLVLCQLERSSARLESDGITRTGTQVFRLITEPA
ncbi:MAG: DUF3168 domain-containing protein [Alphaproteobacteria bacterium]